MNDDNNISLHACRWKDSTSPESRRLNLISPIRMAKTKIGLAHNLLNCVPCLIESRDELWRPNWRHKCQSESVLAAALLPIAGHFACPTAQRKGPATKRFKLTVLRVPLPAPRRSLQPRVVSGLTVSWSCGLATLLEFTEYQKVRKKLGKRLGKRKCRHVV